MNSRIARAGSVLVLLLALTVGDALATTARWGWLGVRIRDLSEQEMDEISKKHGLREGFGAMIVDVIKETPADRAGLQTGDLVVAFKDRPIVDTRTLQRYVAAATVGETVTLTVLRRDLGRRPVQVRLGPMPDPVAAERIAADFGFLVRDPDPQAELGGARPPAGPAAVAVVLPKSRAEAAGLRAGDVFVEVDGKPVVTLDAVRDALLGAPDGGPLSLIVRREQERLSVELPRL
jgi:serine protease Do